MKQRLLDNMTPVNSTPNQSKYGNLIAIVIGLTLAISFAHIWAALIIKSGFELGFMICIFAFIIGRTIQYFTNCIDRNILVNTSAITATSLCVGYTKIINVQLTAAEIDNTIGILDAAKISKDFLTFWDFLWWALSMYICIKFAYKKTSSEKV